MDCLERLGFQSAGVSKTPKAQITCIWVISQRGGPPISVLRMIQLKRTQRSIPKSYMEMFPLFIDDIRRDMHRATMILSSNPVLELALHRENRGPTGNQKESGGNGLGLGILDVGAETHTLMGVGPTRCWVWE